MALIFGLSATPDLNSGLGPIDLYLRKAAHMTIYALLWLTLVRAMGWRRPLVATAIALLYAISDEFHQTFVGGRHGAPLDVAIDGVGMAVAALAWELTRRRRGRPGPPWPLRPAAATASRAP
jgi:VanZ family protein